MQAGEHHETVQIETRLLNARCEMAKREATMQSERQIGEFSALDSTPINTSWIICNFTNTQECILYDMNLDWIFFFFREKRTFSIFRVWYASLIYAERADELMTFSPTQMFEGQFLHTEMRNAYIYLYVVEGRSKSDFITLNSYLWLLWIHRSTEEKYLTRFVRLIGNFIALFVNSFQLILFSVLNCILCFIGLERIFIGSHYRPNWSDVKR